MNRRTFGEIGYFFGLFALALYLACTFNLSLANRGIRQRSDGCGPHPLIALVSAASRPSGSGGPNLNEILRAVKADPDVWSEMLILLRRYDDCVRAGDGLHYKRAPESPRFLSDLDI